MPNDENRLSKADKLDDIDSKDMFEASLPIDLNVEVMFSNPVAIDLKFRLALSLSKVLIVVATPFSNWALSNFMIIIRLSTVVLKI
jgi:hypothetical protein